MKISVNREYTFYFYYSNKNICSSFHVMFKILSDYLSLQQSLFTAVRYSDFKQHLDLDTLIFQITQETNVLLNPVEPKTLFSNALFRIPIETKPVFRFGYNGWCVEKKVYPNSLFTVWKIDYFTERYIFDGNRGKPGDRAQSMHLWLFSLSISVEEAAYVFFSSSRSIRRWNNLSQKRDRERARERKKKRREEIVKKARTPC